MGNDLLWGTNQPTTTTPPTPPQAHRDILATIASTPSRPPDDAVVALLAPLRSAAEAADAASRGRKFAHPHAARAVAELVLGLMWVAYNGPACGKIGGEGGEVVVSATVVFVLSSHPPTHTQSPRHVPPSPTPG